MQAPGLSSMDPSYFWHEKQSPAVASAAAAATNQQQQQAPVPSSANVAHEWASTTADYGNLQYHQPMDHSNYRSTQSGYYGVPQTWGSPASVSGYGGYATTSISPYFINGNTTSGLVDEMQPTTIDPTSLMTAQPSSSYAQYNPSPTQFLPPSAYSLHPQIHDQVTSSSHAVIDIAPSPPPEPQLIDRVKSLLTPKKLDSSPQTVAQRLITFLAPPEPATPPVVDKQTRLEILTRIRDNAPKEFFSVWAKNSMAVWILRDWCKNAVKKEDFGDTLMPLLQVIERLPIPVDILKESGIGKIIKHITTSPPTSAIKDMAAKIELGWRRTLNIDENNPVKPEPVEPSRGKKRKLAETTASTSVKPAGASPSSNATVPPAKRTAVATPSGAKVAVPSKTIPTPPAPSTVVVKDAKTDSSFFSAKPKAKLPSFRKKVATVTTTSNPPPAVKVEDTAAVAQPMDWDPFKDALKSVRKGSPAVPPPSGSVDTDLPSTPPSGISAKTGKPKKVVRFAPDHELEKVKLIERAIYDDDVGAAFQGRSLRDLDRGEGNLFKHKLMAQIDWYEPNAIAFPADIEVKERGLESVEKTTQAEREASVLAAVYQGNPPDTPVEPPSLAALAGTPIDDSQVKLMLAGNEVDSFAQVAMIPPPTTHDLLNQLGGGFGSGAGMTAGLDMYNPYGTQYPATVPGNQETISELLSKLAKGGVLQGLIEQPAAPSVLPPVTPYASGSATAPATSAAALAATLSALGFPPAQPGQSNAYYGGATSDAAKYSYGSSSLPPPLHGDGIRGTDKQHEEDRYRRGGAPRGGARPGGRTIVPASQNTRSPLCEFFAKGRCRKGETCEWSHDPSKLRQ